MKTAVGVLGAVLLLSATAPAGSAQTNAPEARSLVLVVGAPGDSEYAAQFAEAARLWEQAAARGGVRVTRIGGARGTDPSDPSAAHLTDDKTRLVTTLNEESGRGSGELWVVFIGHGTFDGQTARFNLVGPDIAPEEVAAAIKDCRRPLVFVDGSSSSGPFLKPLSGTNRVIVTATRSGSEVNATRFGAFIAKAIADPSADLDKDGQTSLLEAYLFASRQVAQFYREEGRLQTEHALLDDNGDGLGTPPDWYQGVHAVKTAADGKSADGIRAHQMNLVRGEAERELTSAQRAQRDQLEQELSALRLQKGDMDEDKYYAEVERIVSAIAQLYATQ